MLDHDMRRGGSGDRGNRNGRGRGGNGDGNGDGKRAPYRKPERSHPDVVRLLGRAHAVQDQFVFAEGGRRQWNPQAVADAAEATSALVAACRETGCDAAEAARALARDPTLGRHRGAVDAFAPMPELVQATTVACAMYERVLGNVWLPTCPWK